MKIKDFKIYQYALPLRKPLTLKGHTLTKREGFVIQLSNEQGNYGFGEAAPLWGFSREDLPTVKNQLRKAKEQLTGPVPEKVEHLTGQFAAWLHGVRLSPSAQFALEMAVLSLKAHSQHISLARLISKDHEVHVPVSGLLIGNKSDIVKETKQLLEQKFKAIKVKVGGEDLKADIEKVQEVSHLVENKALLRIDANQSWTLKQSLEFAQAVGLRTVEYIEEPLSEYEDIPKFYNETYLPVALDESLSRLNLEEVRSLEGVDILIVKPTLLGGFEKTWQLAQKARSAGLRVIVSSTFESGLGLTALAHLAACISRHIPVGLDTLKWFRADLLKEPFPIKDGNIEISEYPFQANRLNFDFLTEVS